MGCLLHQEPLQVTLQSTAIYGSPRLVLNQVLTQIAQSANFNYF